MWLQTRDGLSSHIWVQIRFLVSSVSVSPHSLFIFCVCRCSKIWDWMCSKQPLRATTPAYSLTARLAQESPTPWWGIRWVLPSSPSLQWCLNGIVYGIKTIIEEFFSVFLERFKFSVKKKAHRGGSRRAANETAGLWLQTLLSHHTCARRHSILRLICTVSVSCCFMIFFKGKTNVLMRQQSSFCLISSS